MGKFLSLFIVAFFPLALVWLYRVEFDYMKLEPLAEPFGYLSFFKPATSGPFDYFRLAHQWPPSVCKPRDPQCPQNFTIHGLWPDNLSGPFLNFCSTQRYVPITGDLLKRVTKSWPDVINHKDSRFWAYEWSKHGTCALCWYKQTEYFTLAVNLKDGYDLLQYLKKKGIKPSHTELYPRQSIFNAVKAYTKKDPVVICNENKSDKLQEIHVCFEPRGSNVVIDCPKNRPRTKCDANIYFPTK